MVPFLHRYKCMLGGCMKIISLIFLTLAAFNLWAENALTPSLKTTQQPSVSYATNLPLNCAIKECLKTKDVQWQVYAQASAGSHFYTYSSKNHSDLLFSSLRSCFDEPTIDTGTGSLPDGSYYMQRKIMDGNKHLLMTIYPVTYKTPESKKSSNKDCKEMIISEDAFESRESNVFL